MSEDHEWSSMDEAGGVAAGFIGTIENWNADAEARMADVLMTIGRYVQGESGCLLGHIKAAVYLEDGKGITLNLIDMDNGVEHHGTLGRSDLVKFNFMCAVLDVDEHELTHEMIHAIDDSGLDYHIDKESLEHHHDHHHHDHEEHEHHHDDDEHEHHDHDHEGGCCHCHPLAEMIDENGKLRPDHHHDHDHDGHCCHHDHDHDHDGHCGCHHHDDDEHEHHHDHDHEGHCCHHHHD